MTDKTGEDDPTEDGGEEGNAPDARPDSSSPARASSSAEPGKPGRPSIIESLTAEQRARFVLLLRSASPLRWACKEVGVFSDDTYNSWVAKAAEGDERYVDFVREAEQARAQSTIGHLVMIGKDPDWRARAWLLERLHPKDFAPLQKQEHSGPDGAALTGPQLVYLPPKDVLPEPPELPEEEA